MVQAKLCYDCFELGQNVYENDRMPFKWALLSFHQTFIYYD